MKKLYTLSLILLGFVAATAQTIYTEGFGTPPAGNPTATAYTGYDTTTAGVTYSGTATARTTSASSGYTGATGAGNMYFGASQVFEIAGINTAAYNTADLTLTFGQLQQNASETTSDNLKLEVSTDGTAYTQVAYARTAATGWSLVTVAGGIPATANLRIRFTQTSTIQYRLDDIKLASVSASCTLALGAATTSCESSTLSTTDTFTVTIPYTGGGNATYNVTTTAGTVTSTPTATAEGNIVITGVPENTNITVTVIGGTCNLSANVVGVYCKPVNELPYYESFDYPAGTVLTNTQKWWLANSGDDILVTEGNLSYTGLAASQGRSIAFAGAGREAYTQFTTQAEGTVFTSFIFNVTDLTAVTTDGTETYFAGWLGENSNSAYRGRIFLKKSGDQYLIGLDGASTTTNYVASAYNTNTPVFVVTSYDFATSTFSTWINPDIANINNNPAATLTTTLTTPAANIGGFILRQDDDAKTPAIAFDELRIGTTLASVVPTTAGVAQNEINGLKVFPNPLNGNVLNITSTANGIKAVAIYDVLGKQVFAGNTVNNTVNVNLTTGIYIVKITEGGKTATRKLAVK